MYVCTVTHRSFVLIRQMQGRPRDRDRVAYLDLRQKGEGALGLLSSCAIKRLNWVEGGKEQGTGG